MCLLPPVSNTQNLEEQAREEKKLKVQLASTLDARYLQPQQSWSCLPSQILLFKHGQCKQLGDDNSKSGAKVFGKKPLIPFVVENYRTRMSESQIRGGDEKKRWRSRRWCVRYQSSTAWRDREANTYIRRWKTKKRRRSDSKWGDAGAKAAKIRYHTH